MFGSLLKAAVGVVIETPLSIAADVVTMGGALTDQKKPYTAQALEKVVENVEQATKPD
jgi:hypothetical protein